jgi:hypothetical protein
MLERSHTCSRPIADIDGPVVAGQFYRRLFDGYASTTTDDGDYPCPDLTRAARALHLAVAEVRKKGAPLERWVPFIHIGP